MAKRTKKTGGEALPAQNTLALVDEGQKNEIVTGSDAAVAHEVHPARSKQPRPWDAARYHISQSTYKAYLKYRQGRECGVAFLEQYILRNPLFSDDDDESAAQHLGKYFEYMATNYHNGTPPVAHVYKLNGPAYQKGDRKPEFRLADDHARIFLTALENLGLQIIEAGRYMRSTTHMVSLLLDVVVHLPESQRDMWEFLVGGFFNSQGARINLSEYPAYQDCHWTTEQGQHYNGGCVIIDLKMSGLLNDKWSEMGWHPDFVDQRAHHGIQAYTYEGVTGLPFFFYVASSKEMDVRFIRSVSNPGQMSTHMANMEKARKEIIRGMSLPEWLRPLPSLGRCSQCPLNLDCKYAAKAPLWSGVSFAIE
jgi:hypothetical protein